VVVELSGTIRGERVQVRWEDGTLSGSSVLLERLRTLQESGRLTARDEGGTADLAATVRALELAAAQRLSLRVIDGRDQSMAS